MSVVAKRDWDEDSVFVEVYREVVVCQEDYEVASFAEYVEVLRQLGEAIFAAN